MPLRYGPVRQIDVVMLYDLDGNASLYPSGNYLLDKARDQVVLQSGVPIPIGERIINPIEITYTTGFDSVPGGIKASLLKLIAYLYEHRGDESVAIPADVLALWQPYRKLKL